MKKYSTYKNSGVEWLGEIPEHWEVKPGFTILSESKKKNTGFIEKTVLSLSYGNVIIKPKEKLTGLVPESFETYQLVKPGDIIIRPTDLQNDKKSLRTGLAKNNGIITSAYINLRINTKNDNDYYHYYLHTIDINKVIYGLGSGLRQNISFLDFKRFPFPTPPLPEQTKIAEFLDDKTKKIDEAIAIKTQQINLLKERKQILIHKAVTRGLDTNVKLKNSGVEWIGEIPVGWEVVPLVKYSTRIDYRGKTPEKVDEGIFLVTTKNIKEGLINYDISKEYVKQKDYNFIMSRGTPKIGDLLFTMEAPLGQSAVVDVENIAIAQRIIKFRFIEDSFDSYFVNYFIQTNKFQLELQKEGTGSTALGIKASKLHKLKLIKPPLSEQKEISSYIEKSSEKIARAIGLKSEEIEKLKEYKSSLINSVVTGKVKVC
ncbi:restriction endonuclease subunit S [Tenacibaculum finnmarkense]|nr:restriction endonuclease subunit S [Tenacibaculum finnmarkense]